MWQNIKYYVTAYAIVIAGTFVSTGLELLPGLFPEFGPIQKLATNLSGITLGSVIMVVGLIRDKRFSESQAEVDKQRKRADTAEATIAQTKQRAELAVQQAEQAAKEAKQQAEFAAQQAAQQAEQERQRAEQERLRAQEAEAELARVRAEHENETRARLRRLEEATGLTPPEPQGDGD